MLIRVNDINNDIVMDYLKEEEEYNLMSINDIKRYGYNQAFFNVWAQIDSLGNIKAILLKYFNLLTLYSKEEYNVEEMSNLISFLKYTQISGKYRTLKPLENYINPKKHRFASFCRLNKDKFLNSTKNIVIKDVKIKKIKYRSLYKIVKLYEDIDEFENTTIENIVSGLRTGRGYYIDDKKKIVSMAKSTSESRNYAMVIGVGTNPKYRNKGLATKCMIKLCYELVKEGKIPCLIYDNEIAGVIYKRLGFEELGKWSIYYL